MTADGRAAICDIPLRSQIERMTGRVCPDDIQNTMTTGPSETTEALPDARPDDEPNADEDEDAAYEMDDDLADSKPKKKRKIIKNSDKKYQCPHGECGKAYSRAEHLYRHQLNRKFQTPSHVNIMEHRLIHAKMLRSRYIVATFRHATATSFELTFAPGIVNATRLKGPISSEKMPSSTVNGQERAGQDLVRQRVSLQSTLRQYNRTMSHSRCRSQSPACRQLVPYKRTLQPPANTTTTRRPTLHR